jgi:multidrug efflux pump subunit AcrA (membrane-fusion protein)
MFSRITFDLDKEEAILLPSMAVLKMQGSNDRYLFVEKNGVAKRISVTIGKRYDDDIEVFSDSLQPGDHIIIAGQSRLLDGIPVEVKN